MNNNSKYLGKFCSVAKKNEKIIPKHIPGYKSPEPQTLKFNGQKFKFLYTPIDYNITYNLDGGKFEVPFKETYTIRDENYYPPTPIRDGYVFDGWQPEMIPHGSIKDKHFIAKWVPNSILLDGIKLNKILNIIANGKENINAIKIIDTLSPIGEMYNISCNNTEIFAWYNDRIVYIYSKNPIYCNKDMSHAFEGMSILMDINCFNQFICEENTKIDCIFKDCKCLSNIESVSNWANGKFSSFKNAFSNTIAFESGRVPNWYKWDIDIKFMSTSGKKINIIHDSKIPNEIIYAPKIDGYLCKNKEIVIDDPNKEYIFEYEPVIYKIGYILDEGILENPKTNYTIEDEDYYPESPVKKNSIFVGWNRDCISTGEFGDAIFIASYKSLQ